MSDFDPRPPDDELNYLDHLDRGLEGPAHGADPDAPARPLLELFPPASPSESNVLTYEIFYGLHEKPFGPSPNPKFLYRSAALDRLLQELLDSIGRRDATVAVTAPLGTGKTTLCRALLGQIDRHTFTSLVTEPFDSIEQLLRMVLLDFGVISRAEADSGRLSGATRAELTFALHEFLLSLVQLQGFAVVLIDDAHELPVEMLDQVRAIADTDQPLLEIVFVGEPVLRGALNRRDARGGRSEPLHLELGLLTEDEVDSYLAHRLAVAGGGQSRIVFDAAAVRLIYDVSRGLPRLVNQMADRTLALGFEDSASLIDGALADQAARDLDLIAPDTPSSKAALKVVTALGLVCLVLIGVAAGLFVFRSRVDRLVKSWVVVPPSPPPPAIRRVEPLVTPPPLDLPPPPVRR